ncbi:MBL fold metallo-hydrolase [Pelagicoccus sp. SDUM812002]|uniref:MBL fold metallo-hydrolase n=1 Tax=Pelagicoccus sp. SDUM812002 TaxID=3041266 RepID=UPI00280F8B59|nr:MBL fold metallo-hydrolase [Pelagicoccus sp. SDUM812002]MDQ8185170.1 MBL fold metallo-hydrolase [Pelagicoccus sp. SDUM812002]
MTKRPDETHNSSRRDMLKALGLGAIALGGSSLSQSTRLHAQSDRPEPNNVRNPWIYAFTIGDSEAWVISDGHFSFNQGLDMMYPKNERDEMKRTLEENYEPTDTIPIYVNILVIRKDSEIVVFDAGFGSVDNPDMGWFREGLATIGIHPSQVTAGFLSHAHGDHIDGFVNADGKPLFPNAAIYTTPEEFSFWRQKDPDFSKSLRPPSWIPGMVRNAQEKFEILAPQIQTVSVGTQALSGLVTVEDGFGHTPGHSIFRIQSAGESLLHIVDLVHNHLLMFRDPAWSIALDHNPELAVSARRRVFAQATEERVRCFGFHVPWPGIGGIAARNKAYAWIPERLWW